MKDGIYAVKFHTPGDQGEGLLVVRGGSINGGDQHFLYRGILTGGGVSWSGPIDVSQWKPGNTTVFGTTGNFVLDARVSVDPNADTFTGNASVRNQPSQTMAFSARRIADLA